MLFGILMIYWTGFRMQHGCSNGGWKMKIIEQCKMCEKRSIETGCPSFKQKQKNVPVTNFDRITESPEAMAENELQRILQIGE